MTVLSLIVLLPILNALAIMLGAPARRSALLASWVQLALTLFAVLGYNRAAGGVQFGSSWHVAPEWGLSLRLGADGLSLIMLLLTALVTVAAVHASPRIEKREGLFYACILLIDAGAAGRRVRICSARLRGASRRESARSRMRRAPTSGMARAR